MCDSEPIWTQLGAVAKDITKRKRSHVNQISLKKQDIGSILIKYSY